jgi:P4 family phage/plasmid primase-like protien
MSQTWLNNVVNSLKTTGNKNIIPAEKLEYHLLANANGSPLYHNMFDFLREDMKGDDNFKNYNGIVRPALGKIFFDFDCHQNPEKAIKQAIKFVKDFQLKSADVAFSGHKGAHVSIDYKEVGIEASVNMTDQLKAIAVELRKTYDTIDTVIYSKVRKLRALNSKHEKTGLFKVIIDENWDMDKIKQTASTRRSTYYKTVPKHHLKSNKAIARIIQNLSEDAPENVGKRLNIKGRVNDQRVMNECEFLKWCLDNPEKVHEPHWYSLLTIVSRFDGGREIAKAMSENFSSPSIDHDKNRIDWKIDHALNDTGPKTCKTIHNEGLFDCSKCKYKDKIKSPIVLGTEKTETSDGFSEVVKTQRGVKITRLPDKLLEHIIKEIHPIKYFGDIKRIMIWRDNKWQKTDEYYIKHYCDKFYKPGRVTKTEAQEFLDFVKRKCIEKQSFLDMANCDGHINFKNGILRLKDMQLLPPTPKFGFTYCIDANWNPNADCPTFKQVLKNVTKNRTHLIQTIEEIFGFITANVEYKPHKIFIFGGAGSNGKTTILEVINHIFKDCATQASISAMGTNGNRFIAAQLEGKLACIAEEEPVSCFAETGVLKKITGNSSLLVEHKGENHFTLKNRAKVIMSYNEVPLLKDISKGMRRRLMIIPFEVDFDDTPDLFIDDIDTKLRAEVEGIMALSVAAYKRMQERGGFLDLQESRALVDDMITQSCQLKYTLEEVLDFTMDHNDVVTVAQLRQLVKEYDQDFKIRPVAFGREIGKLCRYWKEQFRQKVTNSENLDTLLRIYSVKIDTSPKKAIRGIRVKSEFSMRYPLPSGTI